MQRKSPKKWQNNSRSFLFSYLELWNVSRTKIDLVKEDSETLCSVINQDPVTCTQLKPFNTIGKNVFELGERTFVFLGLIFASKLKFTVFCSHNSGQNSDLNFKITWIFELVFHSILPFFLCSDHFHYSCRVKVRILTFRTLIQALFEPLQAIFKFRDCIFFSFHFISFHFSAKTLWLFCSKFF